MSPRTIPPSGAPGSADRESAETLDCLWVCGRGSTRLACCVHCVGDEQYVLEVLRNARIYGTYRFGERSAAVTFAGRLRETFEGNGWVVSA
ncbi:MAG: hypothetical protein ACM3SQ_00420 [Betaproteobacteria bacterium]